MELQTAASIPFPAEAVFAACRDDIVALRPRLAGIRSIEVRRRSERGTLVDTVVDWRAGADVPAAIRALIGRGAFEWTDFATWDAGSLTVVWRSESTALGGAVRCGARDVFVREAPGKTLLRVEGSVEVDPSKIPAVFAPFRSSLARRLEPYLVEKIVASVHGVAAALSAHLTARGSGHARA